MPIESAFFYLILESTGKNRCMQISYDLCSFAGIFVSERHPGGHYVIRECPFKDHQVRAAYTTVGRENFLNVCAQMFRTFGRTEGVLLTGVFHLAPTQMLGRRSGGISPEAGEIIGCE